MAAKRKLEAVYLIERAKINADRQAADKARAEKLTARYLEEDAAQARLVAAKRLVIDQGLADEGLVGVQVVIAAERLKIDAANATRVAAERQKAEMIETEKIAADRLEEDLTLDAERLGQGQRRKQRRVRKIDEDSELNADMKRVFAECFEKKQGEYVHIREVCDIFSKYTSLSAGKSNVTEHHCWTLFRRQWTHSVPVMIHRNGVCFSNMAVKLN